MAFVIAPMSELAGMANASPPPFFLSQRAMPPALTDAPFGMPFGQHPRAGRAEPSFQRFASGADGTYPQAGLIDVNGVIYGTTAYGGQYGYGTVFAVTISGEKRLLHSFDPNGTDGYVPEARLVEENGVLYGTTTAGGQYNFGVVFSVTTSGQERVVHSFDPNGTDGYDPVAGLIDVNGVLYGTTTMGGKYGYGTVFAVTTSGQERVVHSFDLNGADGYNPEAGLIDVSGVLYGTTGYGGQGSLGTVFAVTTTGQERVVHSFGKGVDGAVPQAGLLSVNGVLYGTTTAGGQYNTNGISDGTIFAVTTTGQERVVHSFRSGRTDGHDPLADLVDVNGVLYGTTSGGGQGKYGVGAVFEVTAGGTERIVYSFGSGATDGNGPEAGLIDVNGVLYGTTYAGGRIGGGTVFAVTPSGKERVLHSFGFGT